jgi:hypothetical protein
LRGISVTPDLPPPTPCCGGSEGAWCSAGTQPLGGGYFPFRPPQSSAFRAVNAFFAIQDVTAAPGLLVEMANGGATAESVRVVVRCAHVS